MAGIVHALSVVPDNSYALAVCPTTYTAQRTLAADTAEYINVPTGAKKAVFGSSGTFACRFNATQAGTAAASFADATGGDTTLINPTVIQLVDVAELSLITKGDVYVSVAFFL
jgi:hypothetical protein